MNRPLVFGLTAVLLVAVGGGVLATGASDELFQDVDDVEIAAAEAAEGETPAEAIGDDAWAEDNGDD